MQTLQRLDAGDLVAVVGAYRDALRAHQEAINRLNVYPVPDGDTGTNMSLTLQSVADELQTVDGGDLQAVARALSHGSLMGARGNSGVILSQILRGVAASVAAAGGLDAGSLPGALRAASDGAYAAVGHPVEGTILSVIRAAAEAAAGDHASDSLVGMLDTVRGAAAAALAATPGQLEVLKSAGVVDAGGAGLLLLFDAMLHVADGRPLPEATQADPPARPAATGGGGRGGGGDLRYEVMYLLEAPDETIPGFREVWAGIGDSIVVVGGDGTWNCHIHTNDVGAAVEASLDVGRPRQIRVTDLWDEVEEERWVREAAEHGPAAGDEAPAAPVTCAVVAVCTGEGVARIFRSLGVARIVAGGQTNNPSTGELAGAISAVPADQVVVLPNNKNVVAVAEQAAAGAAKRVRVVPTNGVQEGFAALLEYDPEGDVDANARLMAASAAGIVAGDVTRAVRDSASPVGHINEGDFIGLSRAGIEAVAPTAAQATIALLERLIDDRHHEMVTIIEGDGSTAADTRAITEWLADRQPPLAVEVHSGGQPLYPYLVSVE
jgi:DAK2 domain fusion protein YloV